jgi:hypothetical protein
VLLLLFTSGLRKEPCNEIRTKARYRLDGVHTIL